MAACLPSSRHWFRVAGGKLTSPRFLWILGRALRISGMSCRGPMRQLALELAQPFQLGPKLLNHQADNPHRFMVRVADFVKDGPQRFFLASQFFFNKFAPPSKLFLEDMRACEPRKRDP